MCVTSLCTRGALDGLSRGRSTAALYAQPKTHQLRDSCSVTLMRAAILLSVLVLICGVAALFGYPTVAVNGDPVMGLPALLISVLLAAVFPGAVFVWRKLLSTGSSGLGEGK